MFLGALMYSVVVGSLTLMVIEKIEINENLKNKLIALEEFQKASSLPVEIYHKIKRFV
jgi:hypothetical protein